MELLFLTSDLLGNLFFLKDSRGAWLGTFPSAASARAWCEENGYGMRENIKKAVMK